MIFVNTIFINYTEEVKKEINFINYTEEVKKEIKPVYPNSKIELGTLVFYKNSLYIVEPGITKQDLRLVPVIVDSSRQTIGLVKE